jgi:hypothetical protein
MWGSPGYPPQEGPVLGIEYLEPPYVVGEIEKKS